MLATIFLVIAFSFCFYKFNFTSIFERSSQSVADTLPPSENTFTVDSFKNLNSKYKLHDDFEVMTRIDSSNKNLIFAIHGGTIEPGTMELLSAFQKYQTSLYLFQAIMPYPFPTSSDDLSAANKPHPLHLTSSHFDDPQLIAMAKSNENCLSLHGLYSKNIDVCIGGANDVLNSKFENYLKNIYPKLNICIKCCPPNNGESKANPINMCKSKGIQLEMGASFREAILRDNDFRQNFADNLLNALQSI